MCIAVYVCKGVFVCKGVGGCHLEQAGELRVAVGHVAGLVVERVADPDQGFHRRVLFVRVPLFRERRTPRDVQKNNKKARRQAIKNRAQTSSFVPNLQSLIK